jgi:hypothetical protein
VDVFSKNGQILLEQLANHVNGPEFDIFPYIKLYVLDVISGTWSCKALCVPIDGLFVTVALYLHLHCILYRSTQFRSNVYICRMQFVYM